MSSPKSSTVPPLIEITRRCEEDVADALRTTVPGTAAAIVRFRLMHRALPPYVLHMIPLNAYTPGATAIRVVPPESAVVSSLTVLTRRNPGVSGGNGDGCGAAGGGSVGGAASLV